VKRAIETRAAPAAVGPYSQAIENDGWIFCSGQIGLDAGSGKLGAGGIEAETRRVLENLIARLAAERASNEEIKTFADIGHKMRTAAKSAADIAFMRLDRDFNELVARAACNEFAMRALSCLSALSRRFWYQRYREAADLTLCAMP